MIDFFLWVYLSKELKVPKDIKVFKLLNHLKLKAKSEEWKTSSPLGDWGVNISEKLKDKSEKYKLINNN